MTIVTCLLLILASRLVAGDQALNTLTPQEKDQGFFLLFDGKTVDTSLWDGAVKQHVVRDGLLVADPGGFMFTKKDYANFIFRTEFKMPPDGNSGVGIRCASQGSPGRTGMEIQIIDDDANKNLHPTQYTGAIYGVIAPKLGHLKGPGQWNYMEIIANGPLVKITLNDTVIVDTDLSKVTSFPLGSGKSKLVPKIHNTTGRIALAGHNSPVEFKNMRMKTLEQ